MHYVIGISDMKNSILKDIQNFNARLLFLSIDIYASKNREILDFLYSQGILTDEELEDALTNVIISASRVYYDLLEKYSPDHLPLPEILVYGIENNAFTKEEISRIKFDHGDTVEDFFKEYGNNNILSNLKKRLLSNQ